MAVPLPIFDLPLAVYGSWPWKSITTICCLSLHIRVGDSVTGGKKAGRKPRGGVIGALWADTLLWYNQPNEAVSHKERALKLHEYQAKQILSEAGIPVPRGEVSETAAGAQMIARRLGGQVAVKAQVLVGGRGRSGGILLVDSPAAAGQAAEQLLSGHIGGFPVKKVLVEQGLSIQRELYLGITIDRDRGLPVVIVSTEGGVDIEDTALARPDALVKLYVHPCVGIRCYQSRNLLRSLCIPPDNHREFVEIVERLYDVFWEFDGTLLEVNPLALTRSGCLVALDAKMIVDDNGLFRHSLLSTMQGEELCDRAELQARQAGVSYIPLDGSVGCLVNGAGLAMATMDVLKLYGGAPANFLDVGGGASSERIALAMKLILAEPQVRSVLVNIFGGITRCDDVARGLVTALSVAPARIPITVRLAGTNEAEGRRIIEESNLPVATAQTLQDAARAAVTAAGNAVVM